MEVTLAKDTEREFTLELPFRSKRELKDARKAFKKNVLGREDNGPCWEFYLQFLDESYSVEDIKPNKDRGLDFLVRKYGKEEGEKRYQDRLKKDRMKNTLQGFVERYGKEKGTKLYYEKNKKLSVSERSLKLNGFGDEEINEIRNRHSQKSALTLDNYVEKYGWKEGNEKFEEMEKNRRSQWSKSYWIGQGFDSEDAKRIISGLQRRDLTYFVKKYGEEEGRERYSSFNKKRISATRGTNVSKLELQVYEEVLKTYKDALNTHTIGAYVVDVYIPSIKTVIEVFGDYWHCNPDRWNSEDYNKTLHMTAEEKWHKDEVRIKQLKRDGYNVVVLWESAIKENNLQELINESIK